jgi:hypothetical protein
MENQNNAPQDQPAQQKVAPSIIGAVSIIIIVIIAAIAIFYSHPRSVSQNSQNTSPTAVSDDIGTISYDPQGLNSAIKVTIATTTNDQDYSHYYLVTLVFKIGMFTSGQYAGKTLAIGTFYEKYSDTPMSDTSLSEASNNGWPTDSNIQPYIYFISNDSGNPVAMDPVLMHNDSACYESGSVSECVSTFLNTLGMSQGNETSLSALYDQFKQTNDYILSDSKTHFSSGEDNPADTMITWTSSSVSPQNVQNIGTTTNGWPVMKVANVPGTSILDYPNNQASYYISYPFGAYGKIDPSPDFVSTDDIPSLTWTNGVTTGTTTPVYRYGQYAYGWQDCYDSLPIGQFQSALIQTGTTVNGNPLYEVNPVGHDAIYQCLYQQTKVYTYDSVTGSSSYTQADTYDHFITSHPMFFWLHPTGEWIAFERSDVVPPAEKGKPVIYLYPMKEEVVNVKVAPQGGFAKTDPSYGPANGNGWTVDALPDGTLTNIADGKTYPYLFWEGGKDGITPTPAQGFVVAKADVASTLDEKLALFGLNERERKDFISFWAPRLSQTPYYFITFDPRSDIDRTALLAVTPTPDTIIRVLMDYKPLATPISVTPLQITTTPRIGFTVVEWGGILR